MMPRFTFEAIDKSYIDLLESKIKNLKLNNNDIEQMKVGNTLTIKIAHWNTEPSFTLNKIPIKKEELGMKMIKIQDNTGTSAYHVPEGCLFIFGKDSNRFSKKGTIATHDIKKLIIDTYSQD